ncbi:MAG: hypothetical protein DRI71_11785, partial [Bacteroidetes bacterium]
MQSLDYAKICVNKATWNKFTELEMNDYVNSVFNYYRIYGFPYFKTDSKYRRNEFDKLLNFNFKTILQDSNVR